MTRKQMEDEKSIYKDYGNSKIHLGFVFFIAGCFIPYLFGDRYDQFGQLFAGFIFSIIGAGIAIYLNSNIFHRIIKSYGYKRNPWWKR